MKRTIKCVVVQPLTCYEWPFEVPTILRAGITVGPAPILPNEQDPFWKWALSGCEIESLWGYSKWIRLAFRDAPSGPEVRRMRAVELVRQARVGVDWL